MTYVSFPGIFEKILEINPVAFSVFGREVRWYGLIICIGIILAVANTVRGAKREGICTDDVLDYAIFTIPLAIIGARAYYVITSDADYDSFIDVIAIWKGGLAIYGAIIAGALTVFVVSKIKKISFIKMADAIAPSLLIGQFIGRWGNFCNGEAYGHLDRIEFLGNVIKTPNFQDNYLLRMSVNSEATRGIWVTAHPTFLYESIWNFIGLIIISIIAGKKKFDGQIILCYLAWYGLGRFFIEGLRADSLLLGNTNIRISQLLALLTFVFSLIAVIVISVRRTNAKCENNEYENQFTNATQSVQENSTEVILNTNISKENDNGADN